MKVIMLDIDGVCNCDTTNAVAPSGCTGISDKHIKRLKKIVDATGARVVLSSDWKMANEKDYHYLTQKLWYRGKIRIISQTPNISWDRRGHEIREWLRSNDDIVESYVVLDDTIFDDFDIDGFRDHVIITDAANGLTDDDVSRAIKILNGEGNDEYK